MSIRSESQKPMVAYLGPSWLPTSKLTVQLIYPRGHRRTLHFGRRGMSDYTIHKDPERMKRYLDRHRKREKWTASGIATKGFWARWLLWNKPSLRHSINDTQKKFRIPIKWKTIKGESGSRREKR